MGAQSIADLEGVTPAPPEVVLHSPAVTLSAVKRRYALLERAPALFGLSESDLRVLARRARTAIVPGGNTVVHQGEEGDAVYVVASGRFEVSVAEAPGHSVTIALLGPGDSFGEEGALDGVPRLTTVRALEEGELLVLDRDTLAAVAPPGSRKLDDLQRLVAQRRSSIQVLVERAKVVSPRVTATSIAVYSPKGGSGRTTIALNLAGHLAKAHPGEVALFDLALPYNHAALMTNLVPTNSLALLASTPPAAFEERLLSIVLHHPSSLMVVPTVMRPEEADLITPELVERTLEVLHRTFRYVVIDLGTQMSDAVITALERANRVLLVATPELASIRDVLELQRILTDVLKILPSRVMVALNHRTPKAVIGVAELEKHINHPVVCEVPFEGSKLDEAAMRGEILSVADPRSGIARAVSVVAEILSGAVVAGESKPARRRFGLA